MTEIINAYGPYAFGLVAVVVVVGIVVKAFVYIYERCVKPTNDATTEQTRQLGEISLTNRETAGVLRETVESTRLLHAELRSERQDLEAKHRQST